MSLRNKSRVALLGLMLLAIWPMVHRTLVVEHGINPWKLYGFAMYCLPSFESELLYLASPKRNPERAPAPTRFPIGFEGAADALRDYRHMELGLGDLASKDALAAIVFDARPAIERLLVRRAMGRFDVETAMPVVEYTMDIYERELDGNHRSKRLHRGSPEIPTKDAGT